MLKKKVVFIIAILIIATVIGYISYLARSQIESIDRLTQIDENLVCEYIDKENNMKLVFNQGKIAVMEYIDNNGQKQILSFKIYAAPELYAILGNEKISLDCSLKISKDCSIIKVNYYKSNFEPFNKIKKATFTLDTSSVRTTQGDVA